MAARAQSGVVWNPTMLTGVVLILRSDHATNSGDGTNVTAWNDELGNHNMAQPTGGQQLVYHASGINSLPDVTSAGAQGMYSDQAALGTGALTLAVNVSWTTSTPDRFAFGSRYNNFHYDIGTDLTNPGQLAFRVRTSVSGAVVIKSDSTALNDGAHHAIVCTWDGTTMKMWVDGTQQVQTATATGTVIAPSADNDNNSVCSALDNTNSAFASWIGRISNAIACNAAISGGEVASLSAYLALQ